MKHDHAPLPIRSVARLDLVADDWHWPFATEQRDAIDAHFARLRQARPQLWNGRVLLARDVGFTHDAFHARYFETDFASFIAWRDWGFPDTSIFNCFGMGALRGSDGGFVLGEMAAHTANAGKIYFASGTPDPSDRRDGLVDLAASVAREVQEETGLTAADYRASSCWDCIAAGQLVALIRRLDAAGSSDTLRSRILGALAGQAEPELGAVHIARHPSDILSAMPDFIASYLVAQFAMPTTASTVAAMRCRPGVQP